MSKGKVLQISVEEAKYIDPTQITSLQMVDGSTIVVQGNQNGRRFYRRSN